MKKLSDVVLNIWKQFALTAAILQNDSDKVDKSQNRYPLTYIMTPMSLF